MVDANEIFREIVDVLEDGVHMVGPDGELLYWNRGAERITGIPVHEVMGRRCCQDGLCHLDDDGNALPPSRCPLARTLRDGRPRDLSSSMRDRSGGRVRTTVRTAAFRDRDGRIVGAVELFRARDGEPPVRRRLSELEKLAYFDPLTGLPNRRSVELRLAEFLSEMRRYGRTFGVVMLDVDSFKEVNDTYGHLVGDQVLVMVANTLRSGSRSFDVVGRWGGDEFLVLVKNVDEEQLGHVVRKYRDLVFAAGLAVDSRVLRVGLSAGAMLARPGITADGVLAQADERMYLRKRRRRDEALGASPGTATPA